MAAFTEILPRYNDFSLSAIRTVGNSDQLKQVAKRFLTVSAGSSTLGTFFDDQWSTLFNYIEEPPNPTDNLTSRNYIHNWIFTNLRQADLPPVASLTSAAELIGWLNPDVYPYTLFGNPHYIESKGLQWVLGSNREGLLYLIFGSRVSMGPQVDGNNSIEDVATWFEINSGAPVHALKFPLYYADNGSNASMWDTIIRSFINLEAKWNETSVTLGQELQAIFQVYLQERNKVCLAFYLLKLMELAFYPGMATEKRPFAYPFAFVNPVPPTHCLARLVITPTFQNHQTGTLTYNALEGPIWERIQTAFTNWGPEDAYPEVKAPAVFNVGTLSFHSGIELPLVGSVTVGTPAGPIQVNVPSDPFVAGERDQYWTVLSLAQDITPLEVPPNPLVTCLIAKTGSEYTTTVTSLTDPNYKSVTEVKNEVGGKPPFPWWGYLLIALGVIALLILLFFLVSWYQRRNLSGVTGFPYGFDRGLISLLQGSFR